MRNFVKNLLIFCLAFLLFDRAFLLIAYLAPSREADRRLEKVLEGDMNKDLIILGSSKGARNISAGQIEESTGLTAYNLSYPGSNIEFHEFLLRALLKFNQKPKIVLLTIDDSLELLPSTDINFRLERLYPLIQYDYINEELIRRGEKNRIMSKLFVLHRLNKDNFNLAKRKFTSLDSLRSDGSMTITFQRDGREWQYTHPNSYNIYNEVNEKVKAFKSVIDLCERNDIKLILVFPPNYQSLNRSFYERIMSLSKDDAIPFVYDSTKAEYKQPEYFYDETHLKLNGAEILTNEMIGFLKEID